MRVPRHEGTESAAVRTTTAEVHVLTVGNRQVTLSVAKQLDEVGALELQPFGRIRMRRNSSGRINPVDEWIIGRCHQTGALVVADPWGYESTLEVWNLPLIVLAGLR